MHKAEQQFTKKNIIALIILLCLVGNSFYVHSKYQETLVTLDQRKEMSLIKNAQLKSEIMQLKKRPNEALAFSRLGSYLDRQHRKNNSSYEHDYKLMQHHAHGNTLKTLKERNFDIEIECSLLGSICQESYHTVLFSSKGTFLATTSEDGNVIVWNTESGAILQHLDTPQEKHISSLATSADESLIVAGFEDGLFHLWEMSTGRLLQSKKNHKNSISAITILYDNSLLIIGYNDGLIEISNIKTGEIKHSWMGHEESIFHLSATKDNQIISISLDGHGVKTWDIEGNLIQDFQSPDHEDIILVSSDGKKVVAKSVWKNIFVWDMESGDLLNTLYVDEQLFLSKISSDGKYLTVAYSDGLFEVWDLSTNILQHQLNMQPFPTSSISMSPNGEKIAMTSSDGVINIWDTSMNPLRRVLKKEPKLKNLSLSAGSTRYPVDLSIDSNGNTIAVEADPYNIDIWNMQDGKLLKSFSSSKQISAMSNNGTVLAIGDNDGSVYLNDINSGSKLHSLQLGYPVVDVTLTASQVIATSEQSVKVWNIDQIEYLIHHRGEAFAVNDKKSQVAILSEHQIQMIDLGTGRSGMSFKVDPEENNAADCFLPEQNSDVSTGDCASSKVYQIYLSPNSSFLVTVAPEEIQVWDTRTGDMTFQITTQYGVVQDLAIDSAEQILIFGMFEQPIQIWDLSTGQLRHKLTDHKDSINKIQIHPDGKTFATTSYVDSYVFVWDLYDGHWIHTIKDHGIMDFTISPDGLSIVTDHTNGFVKIWDYPKTDLTTVFQETGVQSNYRICKNTLKAVPVLPFPTDSSVWADAEHCQENTDSLDK